jgi:hypothetical protein
LDNIPNAECYQVAAAQFAVDPKVEQGKVAGSMFQLQPEPNRPDFLRL